MSPREVQVTCPSCNGRGTENCLSCDGTGKEWIRGSSIFDRVRGTDKRRCTSCGGTGRSLCVRCGGSGEITSITD